MAQARVGSAAAFALTVGLLIWCGARWFGRAAGLAAGASSDPDAAGVRSRAHRLAGDDDEPVLHPVPVRRRGVVGSPLHELQTAGAVRFAVGSRPALQDSGGVVGADGRRVGGVPRGAGTRLEGGVAGDRSRRGVRGGGADRVRPRLAVSVAQSWRAHPRISRHDHRARRRAELLPGRRVERRRPRPHALALPAGDDAGDRAGRADGAGGRLGSSARRAGGVSAQSVSRPSRRTLGRTPAHPVRRRGSRPAGARLHPRRKPVRRRAALAGDLPPAGPAGRRRGRTTVRPTERLAAEARGPGGRRVAGDAGGERRLDEPGVAQFVLRWRSADCGGRTGWASSETTGGTR